MKDIPLTAALYRKFGLTMAGCFALIFGLVVPLILGRGLPVWPWIPAGFFLTTAVFMPMQLRLIYLLWMKIGHILGRVNTRILLFLVFFLLFTPTALLLKLLGKDPLHRQLSDDATVSYWQKSSNQPNNHMEKVY